MNSTDTHPSPTSVARLVVYALASKGAAADQAVQLALTGLRPHAQRLVVVVSADMPSVALDPIESIADSIVVVPAGGFDVMHYRRALELEQLGEWEEVLFTGDSWFGPVTDFDEVFQRMAGGDASHWQMIENRHGLLREFPEQGFPRQSWPWLWTLVRRRAIESDAWDRFWRDPGAAHDSEKRFAACFAVAGLKGEYAYPVSAFPSEHPAVFSADLLLDAGCPIAGRELFGLYPPFLQQHAVIGRDILHMLERRGYPMSAVWPTLVRTVSSKALNTNAGMLEVLPGPTRPTGEDHRIAVVAYISDVTLAPELRERLANLPCGYDVIITTNDGVKARQLRALWSSGGDDGARHVDVRVTPANPGRDMSDFFVACRDVILGDEYDLVIKVHARRKRGKTMNLRRYFRRYQWDNLLGEPAYVRALLGLFDREPGLGLVFPPMLHIGYSTMGRGWGPYRAAALVVLKRLEIRVPQDEVSPLAPYGGMWVARPAALRTFAAHGWTYRDYHGPRATDLARVQERIVVSAAAQDGFHARTVLSREHAAIGHTALEFKLDEMLATAPGYPVDQITLLHRAGPTGRGGIVGLSRMYLRLNHPTLSRLLLPPMALAERIFYRTQLVRHSARAVLRDRRRRLSREGLR